MVYEQSTSRLHIMFYYEKKEGFHNMVRKHIWQKKLLEKKEKKQDWWIQIYIRGITKLK